MNVLPIRGKEQARPVGQMRTNLAGLITKRRMQCALDADPAALDVEVPYGDAARGGRERVSLLGLAQCGLGQLSIRDVAHHAQNSIAIESNDPSLVSSWFAR